MGEITVDAEARDTCIAVAVLSPENGTVAVQVAGEKFTGREELTMLVHQLPKNAKPYPRFGTSTPPAGTQRKYLNSQIPLTRDGTLSLSSSSARKPYSSAAAFGEGGGVFWPTDVKMPAPSSSAYPCRGTTNGGFVQMRTDTSLALQTGNETKGGTKFLSGCSCSWQQHLCTLEPLAHLRTEAVGCPPSAAATARRPVARDACQFQ